MVHKVSLLLKGVTTSRFNNLLTMNRFMYVLKKIFVRNNTYLFKNIILERTSYNTKNKLFWYSDKLKLYSNDFLDHFYFSIVLARLFFKKNICVIIVQGTRQFCFCTGCIKKSLKTKLYIFLFNCFLSIGVTNNSDTNLLFLENK